MASGYGTAGILAGLGNLAEGFHKGMLDQMTLNNMQHSQKMQEMMAGIQKNPDTGEYQFTPEKQQQVSLQGTQAQRAKDEMDPASPVSQVHRGLLKSMIDQQGMKMDVPDSMSASDVKELAPLLKTDIGGQFGLLGRQAMMGMMGQRLQQGNARIQMSANNQYSHEMGQTENTLLAANRVNALVQGIEAKSLQSTPQLKSDLSAALSSMLSGGKPATVYGMSHQEFDSAYGRAQKAYQFLTGETGDSMTDAQLGQLKKDVNALAHEYQKQREVKFNAFKQGMPAQVTSGLQNRYQNFTSGAAPAQESGLVQAQDPKIDAYAKQYNLQYDQAAKILKARGYGR